MLYALLGITFVVFLVLGLPIAFVLTVSALSACFYLGYPLDIMCQRFFTAIDSFPLMAIPLFMLAGTFMSKGGITEAIISFALSIVGGIRGSLAKIQPNREVAAMMMAMAAVLTAASMHTGRISVLHRRFIPRRHHSGCGYRPWLSYLFLVVYPQAQLSG